MTGQSDLTIRAGRLADLPVIARIVDTAYAPYIPRLGRRPGPMDDDYGARIDKGQLWIARNGPRPTGLLVLIAEGDTALLDNVAVDPAAQGTGTGRALIDFAEQTAWARGATRLTLYTHVLMTENRALYPRLGFSETHRVTENGFDRVYFAKPLL